MIFVAVFFFSYLLCFCDWLLFFVFLFLFLQNIFVKGSNTYGSYAHSANIWRADKTEVVTVLFEK